MPPTRHRLASLACVTLLAAACSKSQGDSSATAPPPGAGVAGTGHDVPPSAGLPPLPLMSHVTSLVRGNTALVSFDPVPGAKDYRLYLLPQKSDVRLAADGSFDGVNDALYRCAGRRAATGVWVDGNAGPGPNAVPDWISVDTQVDGKGIAGYTRPPAEATLGYAFADAGPDTVPVYAVGDPAAAADNYGYGTRQTQTRAKLYLTDKAAYAGYLGKGWRDDGIVFYAPKSGSAACGGGAPVPVHTTDVQDKNGTLHLFYAAAGEVAKRGPGTAAFDLCPSQAPGSLPVMRAFYRLTSPGGVFGGSAGHDELALGQERFLRARCQGSTFGPCAEAQQSMWEVLWSNITAPTTLIVEALDGGCPFQGLLGAASLPSLPVSADDNNGNTSLVNDQIFTFAELKAKAPHGEVFLNGQFDTTTSPHPIARAAINLAPQERPVMDFASDFAAKPETFTEVLAADGSPDCHLTPELQKQAKNPDGCDTAHGMTSPTYDALYMDVSDKRYAAGVLQGELWTGYTGGKFRFTPRNTPASMSDGTYLHAAMEVSSFSTGRRYPQIIVSTQDLYTSQWLLERSPSGATNPNVQPALFLHPIDAGIGRHVLELELCSQRAWQVNNHCPWFILEKNDPPTPTGVGTSTPHPDLFDKAQDDRITRFDLFVSTQKAYVFVDSRAYGCVDIAHRKATTTEGAPIVPTPAPPPAGPVTVTFGDVQYHAGAEPGYFTAYSPFHLEHMLYETVRHFDYVAFKSGEPAPPWDEGANPCITQMYQGGGSGTQTPEAGN